MGPVWGIRFVVLAVASLLQVGPASAGPAQEDCAPRKRAELPVRMQDGFAFVPGSIGDAPVTLLLDTGAQGMLLTPGIVEALRLPVDPQGGTRMLGTGGVRDAPNVMLRGLRVGGVALAGGSVPVAVLPGVPQTEPPLAGLLGGQFLGAYDLDLDVPHGRMALYDALGCPTPPFPLPYSTLALLSFAGRRRVRHGPGQRREPAGAGRHGITRIDHHGASGRTAGAWRPWLGQSRARGGRVNAAGPAREGANTAGRHRRDHRCPAQRVAPATGPRRHAARAGLPQDGIGCGVSHRTGRVLIQ